MSTEESESEKYIWMRDKWAGRFQAQKFFYLLTFGEIAAATSSQTLQGNDVLLRSAKPYEGNKGPASWASTVGAPHGCYCATCSSPPGAHILWKVASHHQRWWSSASSQGQVEFSKGSRKAVRHESSELVRCVKRCTHTYKTHARTHAHAHKHTHTHTHKTCQLTIDPSMYEYM
jgi:hypothetical protein